MKMRWLMPCLNGKVYQISRYLRTDSVSTAGGGVHARDKDGAISSPRGLDLRPFPRTYAFPTKFHDDSIANFRGP